MGMADLFKKSTTAKNTKNFETRIESGPSDAIGEVHAKTADELLRRTERGSIARFTAVDSPRGPVGAGERVHMIDVTRIFPNPSQPRKTFSSESLLRLADSIKRNGIIQPLVVRRIDDGGAGLANPPSREESEVSLVFSGPIFELIVGERRLRAARMIGMRDVPCIISEVGAQRSAELAIIENIRREDLNFFEEAAAIASLEEHFGCSRDDIAKRLSCSKSYISNKLRLLQLSEGERKQILDAGLTERHARALLKLPDEESRAEVCSHIISRKLNVAQTEAYIDGLLETRPEEDSDKGRRRLIIKDIRLFYNTIDRAVETIEKAGIAVTRQRKDNPDSVELTITVKKRFEDQAPSGNPEPGVDCAASM